MAIVIGIVVAVGVPSVNVPFDVGPVGYILMLALVAAGCELVAFTRALEVPAALVSVKPEIVTISEPMAILPVVVPPRAVMF